MEGPGLGLRARGRRQHLKRNWKGFATSARWVSSTACPARRRAGRGNAAISRAFAGDSIIRSVSGATVADSISVSLPRDGIAAVAPCQSRGFAVTVTDAEILAAIPALARGAGVFAEPAAAATYAGLVKAVASRRLRGGETIVLLVTGSGLKDVQSALRASGRPHRVGVGMADLRRLVAREKIGRI